MATNPTADSVTRAAASDGSIIRSAGKVSASVFLSRITGLLREVILARFFGASAAFDAFLLGFRIPNLTRDLFAEGALSSAFVPIFTQYLSTRSRQEAARLANLVATAIIVVVGSFCLLGMIFSPALVRLLASGWTSDPEKFRLAVEMTRIMFPFLLLVSLAAQAMGMLNACQRFGIPALSSVLFNVGSVSVGLFLGFVAGPYLRLSPIEGMALGVVVGGLLQLLWQVPSLLKEGFRFAPAWDWSHPGLRAVFLMMGPAILGNAAVQVNVLVNTNFATGIVDPLRGLNGPVSWLAYAFRFMQLPLGLFGVAIASATLPSISRSAAASNLEEFRQTLAQSLGLVFLLTIPASVGLIILGKPVVAAIFQGGEFQSYDTEQTAAALSLYAIGLAGYSALKVLVPAFYALGDSRTPMAVSLASIAINYGVAWVMIHVAHLGHASLALSTSAVAISGFLILLWRIRRKIGGIEGRELLNSLVRIAAASVVMGAVVWLLREAGEPLFALGQVGRLVAVSAIIAAGLAAFWAACRAFQVRDLHRAMEALAQPLSRRLRR